MQSHHSLQQFSILCISHSHPRHLHISLCVSIAQHRRRCPPGDGPQRWPSQRDPGQPVALVACRNATGHRGRPPANHVLREFPGDRQHAISRWSSRSGSQLWITIVGLIIAGDFVDAAGCHGRRRFRPVACASDATASIRAPKSHVSGCGRGGHSGCRDGRPACR